MKWKKPTGRFPGGDAACAYQSGWHYPAHCASKLGVFCSRPTAVNLSDAAQRLTKLASNSAAQKDSTPESVTIAVVEACEKMLSDDVAANQVSIVKKIVCLTRYSWLTCLHVFFLVCLRGTV